MFHRLSALWPIVHHENGWLGHSTTESQWPNAEHSPDTYWLAFHLKLGDIPLWWNPTSLTTLLYRDLSYLCVAHIPFPSQSTRTSELHGRALDCNDPLQRLCKLMSHRCKLHESNYCSHSVDLQFRYIIWVGRNLALYNMMVFKINKLYDFISLILS